MDRKEIKELDNSTNTEIGTQVSGSSVVHGGIHSDLSTHTYKAETLILNLSKGQIDPINFNFDLEALQGTTANRDAELEQMHTALARTTASGAKFVVLFGMGGAGKTTLAKLYFKAENDREPFEHLIWIDAEVPENVTESFQHLLTDYLGVHRQIVKDEQLANAVYNQILKRKTIIVFDNVEQVERIRQFFPKLVSPKNPPPHVIVTTRNSAGWQDYKGHLVHVGELSMPVCKDYIRDTLASLKIPDVDKKWAELAEHFGCLVMALRTATMSIVEQTSMHDADDEQPYTLEEFLKEVKKTRVFEDEENQGLFDPVEATYGPLRQLWTATLENLSKLIYGQLAERILQVLAFLSPVGVPVTWIRIVCADLIGPNNKIMMNATHFMISRSLITKSESKYIVHRVFQSTLLSRTKANPEKLMATWDWLLPRIEQLYLQLAAENNLQDFYPNLHTLLKHFELRGNVPDSVVSFLVAMKLSGSYACGNLSDALVVKIAQKVVTVSRKSLELVLAQSLHRNSLLLLPDWIRDYSDKIPIQQQLRQINKYLAPFDTAVQPFRKLYSLIEIYSAVVQVLEKWESNVGLQEHSLAAEPVLDILNIVERLCCGLCRYHFSDLAITLFKRSKYSDIHTVLQGLKKVNDDVRAGVFRQSDNLQTKLKYIDVVYKWFRFLVDMERSLCETRFAWCEMTTLESAFNFSFTGFDHVMIDWYQVQLERFYRTYNGNNHYRRKFTPEFSLLKLEATFVVAVVTVLITSLSDSKQDQSKVAGVYKCIRTSEAKILDQVTQFLNFSMDRKEMLTEDRVLNCFIGAYVVYLALEPHLGLLERILDRLEEASTHVPVKQKLIVELEPFVESIRRNITKYTTRLKNRWSLLGVFSEQFAHCDDPVGIKKHILPNVEKLIDVTDKILIHCEPLLSSPLVGSNPCNIERLTNKLENDYYRHRRQGANELTQLRAALEEAYKAAEVQGDSSDTRNCKCIVARIQMLLARLDLEDGKTGPAIQQASEAFNHQLYCHGSNKINRTVEVLFGAFGMCNDSQARKLDLLRKLFNGHMDVYGPDHWISDESKNKLIHLLCSTGSIPEAADIVEKLINSRSIHTGCNDYYPDLTVSLLLLMSGETERVVSITECMLRHVKTFDLTSNHQRRLYDKIFPFATVLREVGTSGLASFKDYGNNEFRKCALALIDNIWSRRPVIYQQWIDNRVQFMYVNEEAKDREKVLINTTKLLYRDDLTILWFDTMEQVLCREPTDSASLFAPLEHQLKLRNVDMEFKLEEDDLEWSIKCFVGMFQRQQLWFQKTSLQTDEAEEPEEKRRKQT